VIRRERKRRRGRCPGSNDQIFLKASVLDILRGKGKKGGEVKKKVKKGLI